ncbi:ubiquitin domain-containing protein 2-like isoform X2 [Salvia splendens]|uniref:ubiquitin domain-containing protein 2-like isoform X2 n=1 Tax=Salvia splendens TaxID=180675 RepID=UPI001C2664E9|nr:ubiquitin domain-containing protein 2-like isoform X2 [Salvia splendens]
MGCAGSSQAKAEGKRDSNLGTYYIIVSTTLMMPVLPMTGGVKQVKKPRSWKHPQPITISQLFQLREEFWDTAPHYGGRKEIWDALRAAAEADPKLSQVIVESAGIILQNPDMTVCFDERGARYELPTYVLSEPKNLIRDS